MRTRLLVAAALIAISTTASAKTSENGIFVNTSTLNGIFVNGRELSNSFLTAAALGDEQINGVKPIPAYKDGFTLYYPQVQGTGLAGWVSDNANPGWVWKSGEFFKGTVMQAGVYDKSTGATDIVNIRIADVKPLNDMLLHNVEVQSIQGSGIFTISRWVPLCGKDPYTKQPIPSIVLRGEWNMAQGTSTGGDKISDSPYRVTFACVNGALGKCAATCSNEAQCSANGVPYALGYKPWVGAVNEWNYDHFQWRDYTLEHQACTRMIRADYCGDGRSGTANGTLIDVYDRFFNHQVTTLSSSWLYEATWNEDGAVRIGCGRLKMETITCPVQVGASPAAIMLVEHPLVCYEDNGLSNATARMGNLRHVGTFLPIPVF